VSKRRNSDGKMAADFITYVDDARSCGGSWQEARDASRRIASLMNWLGIQDAARERRDPSRTPGAWAGSIVHTEDGVITVSVSQERWDKAKGIISWIEAEMSESDNIDFKLLESYRGFLVYLTRTYPDINPYLKGIHLTLDSWRPWRKEDGWKTTLGEIRTALEEKGEDGTPLSIHVNKAPLRVKWVPRLVDDVRALKTLLSASIPSKRLVRPVKGTMVAYNFGDASGSGFGSSLAIGDKVVFKSGQSDDEHNMATSNFRELSNLIYTIEENNTKGLLEKTELFVFTDNSTAEAAFYKGTSSSAKLFDLVLRLRIIQMNGSIIVHFVHVTGK
jgi:hypothetical protein